MGLLKITVIKTEDLESISNYFLDEELKFHIRTGFWKVEILKARYELGREEKPTGAGGNVLMGRSVTGTGLSGISFSMGAQERAAGLSAEGGFLLLRTATNLAPLCLKKVY